MKQVIVKPVESPLTAQVSIPGSKSYTNRALIIAALSSKAVTVRNYLKSDDTAAMIECLSQLGFSLNVQDDLIKVSPSIEPASRKTIELNARLSGTTIRFILALACVMPGTKILTGLEGLNKRPIKDLVDGLRQLCANIEYSERDGYPPLKIMSSVLKPGITKLNGDISSQYFSAIMMIAPQVGELAIEVVGNQISKSYIDMTIDTMRQFGVIVENNDYKSYKIRSRQKYTLDEYTVEGDYSGAGYFLGLGALTKSRIELKNLNPHSKQGDRRFADILKTMGNEIIEGNSSLTIIGHGVKPIEVDMELCPDQAQTLAVLAAFAPGKTVIKGIRSLRVKETERVVAIQNELKKMRINTEATNDVLTIFGGNPKPATIDTYGDHRMAMSFSLAGTIINGIRINNPQVVEKTFPSFWETMSQSGVKISYE